MKAYREEGFPITIVRPSLTYGDTQIPLAVNSWEKSYTVVDRMRRGKKVIVPGDGTSLWVITHNSDFAKGLVGLLGHRAGHRPRLPHHQRRSDDAGTSSTASPRKRPARRRNWSTCRPISWPPASRKAGQPGGGQIGERGFRQLQDQALRSRLLRHGAVPRRHPADRRLVRRGPGPAGDRCGRQCPLGQVDRGMGTRHGRHPARVSGVARYSGERAGRGAARLRVEPKTGIATYEHE